MGNRPAWRSRRKGTLAAAFLVLACGCGPGHAQGQGQRPTAQPMPAQAQGATSPRPGGGQASSQAQGQGQPPAGAAAPDETPRGKLLAFTEATAAAAGALSVCNPRAYTEVRLCGILVITHWKDLGQTLPPESDTAQAVEDSWQKAAGNARDIQAGSSPPLSCIALLDKARSLQLWELCGAARRLEAQALAARQPAAGNRQNPRPGPQPRQVQPQSQPQPRQQPNGIDVFKME